MPFHNNKVTVKLDDDPMPNYNSGSFDTPTKSRNSSGQVSKTGIDLNAAQGELAAYQDSLSNSNSSTKQPFSIPNNIMNSFVSHFEPASFDDTSFAGQYNDNNMHSTDADHPACVQFSLPPSSPQSVFGTYNASEHNNRLMAYGMYGASSCDSTISNRQGAFDAAAPQLNYATFTSAPTSAARTKSHLPTIFDSSIGGSPTSVYDSTLAVNSPTLSGGHARSSPRSSSDDNSYIPPHASISQIPTTALMQEGFRTSRDRNTKVKVEHSSPASYNPADDSTFDDSDDEEPSTKRNRINRSGGPRRPRQPRPKLLKWTDNDWKNVALGIVWACGEAGMSIPFDQAAQIVNDSCTAGALQQAILKLRAKQCALGHQIPVLKMGWTRKNQNIPVALSGAMASSPQTLDRKLITPKKKPTLSESSQSLIVTLKVPHRALDSATSFAQFGLEKNNETSFQSPVMQLSQVLDEHDSDFACSLNKVNVPKESAEHIVSDGVQDPKIMDDFSAFLANIKDAANEKAVAGSSMNTSALSMNDEDDKVFHTPGARDTSSMWNSDGDTMVNSPNSPWSTHYTYSTNTIGSWANGNGVDAITKSIRTAGVDAPGNDVGNTKSFESHDYPAATSAFEAPTYAAPFTPPNTARANKIISDDLNSMRRADGAFNSQGNIDVRFNGDAFDMHRSPWSWMADSAPQRFTSAPSFEDTVRDNKRKRD